MRRFSHYRSNITQLNTIACLSSCGLWVRKDNDDHIQETVVWCLDMAVRHTLPYFTNLRFFQS